MLRVAHWRGTKLEHYNDPRNQRAAALLAELEATAEMSDADWGFFRTHFNWASLRWQEAVGTANRMVGYRPGITDFYSYLSTLRGLLA